MKLKEADKNFVIPGIEEDKTDFYDVREAPFRLYGLYRPEEGGMFRRMKREVAEKTSPGVLYLSENTAGGRVRFRTDSPFVALRADMPTPEFMEHMPPSGEAGFDLYFYKDGKSVYHRSLMPSEEGFRSENNAGVSSVDACFCELPADYMKTDGFYDIIINFPLYASVRDVYIGVEKGRRVLPGSAYKNEGKPVVFYGSSITQGGCASRPGNAYPAVLSRRFDFDYINLGFSGNAKAEEEMAAYIASLPMSVFVYDYDHNCNSPEHLAETHPRMYKTVRDKNPDLPIICMSAPNIDANPAYYGARREIVMKTFIDAKAAGDKNIYFVDGAHLFGGEDRDACTVDGCHPNDLGFYRMADAVSGVLKQILCTEGI